MQSHPFMNWYKIACMANILHTLIWVKFVSMLPMYVQSGTQAFSLKNYCGFNTKSYCSDVCGYHRRPQTLVEICRNMGICCGFRAVAAEGKYPGFTLLLTAENVPVVLILDPQIKRIQFDKSRARAGGYQLKSMLNSMLVNKLQGFSNMASDWLAAVLPANQMPGIKICVN